MAASGLDRPRIDMLDLPRQQESLGAALTEAIREAIVNAEYLPGRLSAEPTTPFEAKLADYCDRRFAVGVGSGTSALHLALLAAGVGPEHQVVTAPNSFFATAEAIVQTGARPVFADVDPVTHLVGAGSVEPVLTSATGAVVPVHLYGNVVDVDGIEAMLDRVGREDVAVIEDCAHAMGAGFDSRAVPLGPVGAFSFNPVKNLGGLSDGGAVVTDDHEIARRVRLLANHGSTPDATHEVLGFNSRLGSLNDRVLSIKIDHLDAWNDRRRAIAARYDAVFRKLDGVEPVGTGPDTRHARHQYVVCLDDRERVRDRLAAAGIATRIHYPSLIPATPAFVARGYSVRVPEASRLNALILSLPCHPELEPDDVEYVIEHVAGALAEGGR